MPAITYTVTDPVTGMVFKSRRKTRPYGAVIVDGIDGPRVDAWAGRADLLAAYHRRALNGRRHWSNPDHSARVALATESHPAIRARLRRTFADLEAHPWVDWIDDSRHLDDGLHLYLRPGFVWDGTTSAVRESTVREVCQAFRDVTWDPAAWGEACGASPAEVAALTGEATPAPAAPAEAAPAPAAPAEAAPAPAAPAEAAPAPTEATPAALTSGQTEAAWHLMLTRAVGRQTAPRPVLPGEATPPPAPSHGEAAPTLPRLRADAAAGRPVSLSAVAIAAQSEMAARRAARRAARTGG